MKKFNLTLFFSGLSCLAAVAFLCSCGGAATRQADPRPRIIVTTDQELDDLNSVIRLLLFSTDYRVEGLIYASSQVHWAGDGSGTTMNRPGSEYDRLGLGPVSSWRWNPDVHHIDEVVDAYEACYDNLLVHNPTFPTPESLRAVTCYGNIEFEGDYSKDTPGSELIKKVILDDGDPVFVEAWGGPSTIARALKSIEETYKGSENWPAIRQKVIDKTILSLSGLQDSSYDEYIAVAWPEIRQMPMSGTTAGVGYMAEFYANPESKHFYQPEWMRENIIGIGPLGSIYRYWGDGKQMVEGDPTDYFGFSGLSDEDLRSMGYMIWCPMAPKGSFISEGDTPCFLNLIDNGLRAHEDPTYGGWIIGQVDLPDSLSLPPIFASISPWIKEHYPTPDFTAPVFNGLAARLKWTVTPSYEDANHEPVISGALALSGKPGQTIKLKYEVSDPDGDEISVKWWDYKAASTYKGAVAVADPASACTTFTVPSDAQSGQTIHLILEATDNGTPALNRYLRAIVTVK